MDNIYSLPLARCFLRLTDMTYQIGAPPVHRPKWQSQGQHQGISTKQELPLYRRFGGQGRGPNNVGSQRSSRYLNGLNMRPLCVLQSRPTGVDRQHSIRRYLNIAA